MNLLPNKVSDMNSERSHIFVNKGPVPRKDAELVVRKHSTLERVAITLSKPGMNLLVYLIIALMISLAVVTYAALMRPDRYVYKDGTVFDTHTGDCSFVSYGVGNEPVLKKLTK